MTGCPLKCPNGHQWLIMAGTPCDTCPACGLEGGFDAAGRTHLRGRYVDFKFIPHPDEDAERERCEAPERNRERIREDTARLMRLFLMIDGRLKFHILVSRFQK